MKIAVDDTFRVQVQKYDLAFTCERCAHFDETAASCGHGYPTDEHREKASRVVLTFCKEWESA